MKVVVATYEHRHGTDIQAFDSLEKAESWREEIARQYWDDLNGTDVPEEFEADYYWDAMSDYGGEWFNYEWYEVT